MSQITLTPQQVEELTAANLKNIVDKVAAGGVLYKREMELIREHTQSEIEPEPAPVRAPHGRGHHLTRVRWSLDLASKEFQRDYKALARSIKALDIHPSKEDGKYSTADIAKAVYGDLHSERLRLTREQADAIGMDNERERRSLSEDWLPRQATFDRLAAGIMAMRAEVLSWAIPPEQQDALISRLRAVKL